MTSAPQKPVRVRMPPSPSGFIHIGTARTALFNWLFARQHKGVFIFRIEDTDAVRSKPEYESQLIEALHWLGLEWDEGLDLDKSGQLISRGQHSPYRSSERTEIYRKYLERLLAEKKAYYCYCTKEELEAERQVQLAEGLPPKYSGHCRNLTAPPPDREPQVIRFKVQETTVAFSDLIRGKVSFDAALFGDIVIARNLNSPLYNLAVTVDDQVMDISHVIRGEDLLSNTPKQILLQHALGFNMPHYAHIPLILNSDRSKLSKRTNQSSLLNYRERGYLPEAMVNFLALLGWHPAGDREVLTLDQLIKEFNLKKVQKSGAIFNQEKLDWLNGQYLKNLPTEDMVAYFKKHLPAHQSQHFSQETLAKIVLALRDRLRNLHELVSLAQFFFALPDYRRDILVWREDSVPKTQGVLAKLHDHLTALNPEAFGASDKLIYELEPLVTKYGKGSVLWPLRVAVSGQVASPDPFTIMVVLGKAETLNRLNAALNKIGLAI